MQTDDRFYDIIIVGAGPAGLSAAIYAARAKYKVLVLEKAGIGGQITITEEIVNYPGIESTSGKELTEKMRKQAENFGAEFAIAEVTDMELHEDVKLLQTTKGGFRALGIVLATGANPRKLGFKGEKEFQGRGVAYCATCDGEFFTGKEVFVIGGGFAAVEEGIFLTKYASKVTLIVREPDFTCAKTVSDKLKEHDKIEVIFETEIVEAGGESKLTYAKFRNNRTGEVWTHEKENKETLGIFVFAGYVPDTDWFDCGIEKNEQGYIVTDMNKKTNIDGVYAAGDVCVKNLRQVVTAVSDGAVAATSLEKVAAKLHTRLDIPDLVKEGQGRKGKMPETAADKDVSSGAEGFITAEIRQKLPDVFARFEQNIILRLWEDGSALSEEMKGFLMEFDEIAEKASVEIRNEKEKANCIRPAIEICRADGSRSGIYFHGVPGGHEFNSFIMALYNVAGPGQEIEEELRQFLSSYKQKRNLKILVSLSCTMCPETVMSAQRAASLSDYVQAEMFDLAHFPDMKEKYDVMSVPCLILNDSKVFFGKKNIAEMAEILKENI